jgi:outer membrane protease
MKKIIALAALAAASTLTMAAPASAAVVVCQTPNCAGASNNVNLPTVTSASTITGTFTGGTLTFSSDELLDSTANGVARVSAVEDPINNTLVLTSSTLLSALEFNLTAFTNGNVQFVLNGGTLDGQSIFAVATNGQNKFGLSGGTFQGVTLNFGSLTTGGASIQDIRQVAVNAAAPVPEPTTWAMMLVGFGAVGYSMRGRKRNQLALQAV